MSFIKQLKNSLSDYAKFYAKTDLSSFTLDMFLGEDCNLNCKHCYFGNYRAQGRPIDVTLWKRIINDFTAYNCNHFHISGKESLLTPHTLDIIKYLNDIKLKKNNNLFWGIISNGTSVPYNIYNDILSTSIDYLEFSIDGEKMNHDIIRGYGTYEKLLSTLYHLNEFSKISISYTINATNCDDLKYTINRIYNLGVRKFYCSPTRSIGRARINKLPLISPKKYLEIIDELRESVVENKFHHTNIKFHIPTDYLEEFLNSPKYKEEIRAYFQTYKPLYWTIGSNIIELSLQTISIPLFAHASITSDGKIIESSNSVEFSNEYGTYKNITSFMNLRKKSILNYFNI